jgi:hypothetical protein
MSTESTAASAITEEAIEREAARLIASSAAKNNISVDAIPEDAKQQAREYAKANLQREAARLAADESSPYRKMYSEAQKRAELAEAQLAAVRGTRVQSNEHVIVETAERARARAGEVGWSRMTVEQRLASIGVDHRTVDKVELSQLFGPTSDHKRATDMHRTDQRKYKTLKETAKILGLY